MLVTSGFFPLGHLLITRNALSVLNANDVVSAVVRHTFGDWGELCDEDRKLNDQAVLDGSRLLSAYTDSGRVRFWIITEADRSATTILLPEDY